MTKPSPRTGLLSVYDGGRCLGHVLPCGRQGFEAFDLEDKSLGVFTSRTAAIAAAKAEAP
jgi:hypothetical protein